MIRVLVVEDENRIRKGIVMTTDWASLGCQVVGEAASGEEGLRLMKEKKPDIVLTDIRMKGISGIEMIESVKEKERPSFIILSGYSDFDYARSALRLGVEDYLLKPFKDQELIATLRKVIARRGAEKKEEKAFSVDFFKEYPVVPGEGNAYVLKCLACLAEHYMKETSCSAMAEELGISESYLSKLFKKETGYSFVDYLTHYRMKKAVEIMRTDSPKIYELAYMVGYNDAHYFSNMFKRITGKSPSEMKKDVDQGKGSSGPS